jgi:hypothetical protein
MPSSGHGPGDPQVDREHLAAMLQSLNETLTEGFPRKD